MPIDAKELAQRYVNALTEIGVVAKIDDESDVVFKMPGVGSFYISLDAEDDPEFMRLVYRNLQANGVRPQAPQVYGVYELEQLQPFLDDPDCWLVSSIEEA